MIASSLRPEDLLFTYVRILPGLNRTDPRVHFVEQPDNSLPDLPDRDLRTLCGLGPMWRREIDICPGLGPRPCADCMRISIAPEGPPVTVEQWLLVLLTCNRKWNRAMQVQVPGAEERSISSAIDGTGLVMITLPPFGDSTVVRFNTLWTGLSTGEQVLWRYRVPQRLALEWALSGHLHDDALLAEWAGPRRTLDDSADGGQPTGHRSAVSPATRPRFHASRSEVGSALDVAYYQGDPCAGS
ncbi:MULTISPECIES: hypothetical protein [unclassified Crossiella]|uniref:hypothetical protein n=1 Tax=unclassified Crossiella TaxID=2620835 RepID=UPI002000336B|nr:MULTISPECIES: hypothetical protein [unclassified Crossiella]MCK2240942.1 hypothetical protein [Crossiella sp. S99.2]MCK2253914.1 hypothetical protein [Crossiella sp. S99.1]